MEAKRNSEKRARRMAKPLILVALGVWFVGVVAAFILVWNYKTKPGPAGTAPAIWPRESSIIPTPGKANLVLFAHPQCPCTRASMAELERLASELGPTTQIHVVLVRPDGTEAGFEEGAVADRAHAIGGVDVLVDDGGKEADRFGAKTSGATVLYTRDGKLAFSGGLTTARGHEGRGPAQDRIVHAVTHDASPAATAPTFGCELHERETRVAQ